MTRKTIKIILFCLLANTAFILAGLPKIELSSLAIDYGKVGNRKKLKKTLIINNKGTAILRITRIRSSCSCTKVQIKKRLLEPGEKTELFSILSTGRVMGTLHKYIEISTNDPNHSNLRIPVIARVHAGVKAIPWTLPRFTAVAGGKKITQKFVLKWRKTNQRNLDLKNLEALDKHISAHITPIKTNGYINQYDIVLTIIPPSKEGFFSSVLRAKLNGLDWEFPIHGYVFSGIIVEPRYFQFGRITDPKRAKSSIQLISTDNQPFHITEIKSDPEILWFNVDSSPDGLKHKITAQISIADLSKQFLTKVTIHTSHPKKPIIKINCLGFWAHPKKTKEQK